jgi:hypothetical protein
MNEIRRHDWVTVKPEHDIPPIFRPDGKPTRGRVERVKDGVAEVWVPIGDADVDEHSQGVPYPLEALEPEQLGEER